MTEHSIDDATIVAAERLVAVSYSDAEREQMRDNLVGQIDHAIARRAVRLPNASPPATLFDPRLPGFAMPAQATMSVPLQASPLPDNDEDIAFASVRRLAAWIAAGSTLGLGVAAVLIRRWPDLLASPWGVTRFGLAAAAGAAIAATVGLATMAIGAPR